MANLTADLKFDLNKNSLIILQNDLIIHKWPTQKCSDIETKELRRMMIYGEDMDTECAEKLGKRKGFGKPVYGT